jgi:hypothetical protein
MNRQVSKKNRDYQERSEPIFHAQLVSLGFATDGTAMRQHADQPTESPIPQLRKHRAHPVDLTHLPLRQSFIRIQTPDPLHQPLPPQNLVDSCNASAESIRNVEDRRIRGRQFPGNVAPTR